jgi:hypothetical protein
VVNRRTVPERYVTLCLRVGAHVEDFVDAYIGPPGLEQEIAAEEPHDPRSLRDDALALLEELPNEDLEEDRVQWLLGQLRAIECVTAGLAGEDIAWSDEAERCFGIRPQHVDEDAFRASHDKLDDVLPGSGDLSSRYNAWIDTSEVPRETVPRAIGTLSAELRGRSAGLVDLPRGEGVDYESVTGEFWQAFNVYRGDLRSLVRVNLDLPLSIVDLLALVAHESYPGHHTERACKEQHVYRDKARVEMSVMIDSAPEAVIAEGIATNALEVAVGDGGFGALLEVTEELGFHVDAAVAEVVFREEWQLWAAAANAARMLYEDGTTPDEVQSYVQEWTLYSPERAAKTVSYLVGTRAYVIALTEGKRLCRAFIDRHPDGFRRLLTEQLTVSSLLKEASESEVTGYWPSKQRS